MDSQAATLEPATRLLLQASGVGPGLRVLDLGTGLGHVARLVAHIVGPTGAVVGIDQSVDALAVAKQRSDAAGDAHVSFVHADVQHWRGPEPFDAIVGRLVLFHVPDPLAVVRHHLQNLRQGGLFVAIDFDAVAARAEPPVAVVQEALSWIRQAFAAAGASPAIGARLGTMLRDAGLVDVKTFGVQAYLPPGDPSGPALVAGVVRSLVGTIATHGIATPEQIGLDTLEPRMAEALSRAKAVLLPPTVVGAWGRLPAKG